MVQVDDNVRTSLCTMGKLKMFGIGMTVAVVLLAYFLYTPMPPEAEEPYRQMAFLARFKLVLGLVSMKYGFVTQLLSVNVRSFKQSQSILWMIIGTSADIKGVNHSKCIFDIFKALLFPTLFNLYSSSPVIKCWDREPKSYRSIHAIFSLFILCRPKGKSRWNKK